MSNTHQLNNELSEVLGQIKWADGLAKTCQPYTPSEAEARAAWGKMRNMSALRWGCRLSIVFKEDADWAAEEDGGLEVPDDRGYLIALPGQSCSGEEDGIVWVPHTRGEKCEGDPVWMHLLVLLANPEVAWVEVLK